MKSKLLIAIAACTLIAACSTAYMAYDVYKQNDDNQKETSERQKHVLVDEMETTSVTDSHMSSDRAEPAQNIPVDEEGVILTAYARYIDAMNTKDLAQYKEIVSKNTTSFNYEEDMEAIAEMFDQYDINREARYTVITKYTEKEAHVFSTIQTETVERATDTPYIHSGRQVTVFTNEMDEWKITSIYYVEATLSEQPIHAQEVYEFMQKKLDTITNNGATYIPDIHDPIVTKIAAQYFGIMEDEVDEMYMEAATSMYD